MLICDTGTIEICTSKSNFFTGSLKTTGLRMPVTGEIIGPIMAIYDTNDISPDTRPKIVVLALPGTTLSSIAAATDVFSSAGTMWNKIMGNPAAPVFDVQLVSPTGDPISCMGIPSLSVHRGMHDVNDADLIIVSALLSNKCAGDHIPEVIEWLVRQHAQGSSLASLCTGAFILAATGLLNGKTATTHWGVAEKLQQMYPEVLVTPHRLITDEGTLFTSGGTHGALDLCLYLVEKFSTRETSLQCAKVLVRDFYSNSQSPYATFIRNQHHMDMEIKKVQEYLEITYSTFQTIESLALRAGLGKRTFERRFKAATGSSPRTYIQRLRIEAAKRILETQNKSIEEITDVVGYTDAAAFSKLFSRICGVSPSGYRRKFCQVY